MAFFFSLRSDKITLNSHISPKVYKAEVSECRMIGLDTHGCKHMKDCKNTLWKAQLSATSALEFRSQQKKHTGILLPATNSKNCTENPEKKVRRISLYFQIQDSELFSYLLYYRALKHWHLYSRPRIGSTDVFITQE